MTENLTFAALLEPGGIVAAAAAVTLFVQLIKTTFPVIDANVSGALMAFSCAAVLYVLAAISTNVQTLDAGLVVFLAWLTCAAAAVGLKSTATHVGAVRG